MRKTLLIKIVLFTIIFSFKLSLFNFAFAQSSDKYENIIIKPQNIAIIKATNNITLGALGKLTCMGKTHVLYGYSAGITMELQEYKNKDWTTIKTWTGIDADCVELTTSYYVAKGTYRLKLTHKAYDSNMKQIESFVNYSNTIIYE